MSEPIVWQDRQAKVEDGNFVFSRRGAHDEYDFASTDKDAAFAGNVNAGAWVRRLEVIDNSRIRIYSSTGTYVLTGGDTDTFRIDQER